MTLRADRAFAQRLERAEATANAAFVEARARVEPASGACWIEVAGAYAMFDAIGSPLTQAFGAGVFADFDDAAFARVEAFFSERGAATHLEVSSLADAAMARQLEARGYRAIERSVVLIRDTAVPAAPVAAPDPGIAVRIANADEVERWAEVSSRGWSSAGAEVSAFVRQLGRIMGRAQGVRCFLAESAGAPIATGALYLANGVAVLAGASTVPAHRGRGAQRALLEARLAHAAAAGIDLAMVVTEPESGSQRNAERSGFRLAYRRTKWERGAPGSIARLQAVPHLSTDPPRRLPCPSRSCITRPSPLPPSVRSR